jgi:RNA polymerase sigma-70 factor (ECF subfamily)
MATMGELAVADVEGTDAFEAFFHNHYERLLRAMYLATGDRHEAEDLAQDALVRVCERWVKVRSLEDPVGYLYRVALNLRRGRLRRLATAARRTFGASPPPRDEAEAAGERDAVRRALAGLPDGQREALVLVDWLGMTDREAAAALGVSDGALRTRLHRARTTMRETLRGNGDE